MTERTLGPNLVWHDADPSTAGAALDSLRASAPKAFADCVLCRARQVLLPFYAHTEPLRELVRGVTAPLHVQDFAAGIVDTRTVVWYLSATVLLLFASIRILEARRLR